MLVIRNQQLESMRLSSRLDFERRLARHLRQETGQSYTPGAPPLSTSIDALLEMGIRRECDVARYMILMCAAVGSPSPGALPPDAMNLLLAHGVDGGTKVERLAQWLESHLPAGRSNA